MALTRKMLKAMGIEEDKIEQIIDAHTETVSALKEERDNYKTDAERLPAVQTELDNLKKDAEKKDPFEQKYNDLKTEYEDYKNQQTAKETKAKKERAYSTLLKEIGISEKRIPSILKVTDLENVELDGDSIKGSDKIAETAKTEWADFIVTVGEKGADVSKPPKGDGGSESTGRARQLAKQYHENLYGKAREE